MTVATANQRLQRIVQLNRESSTFDQGVWYPIVVRWTKFKLPPYAIVDIENDDGSSYQKDYAGIIGYGLMVPGKFRVVAYSYNAADRFSKNRGT